MPTRRPTEALTGARALAASWVVLFHLFIFANSVFGNDRTLEVVASQGYLGVDFFFLLSGFILALQYLDAMSQPTPHSVSRFLLLRLARIYPLHVLTMIGVAAIACLGAILGKASANPNQLSLSGMVANLLLVHSWGWSNTFSWNEPSWSISCEWFAYLCFPLLAVGYGRVRRKASAFICCLCPLLLMFGALRLLGQASVSQTLRFGLLRIAGEFSCGAGLYLLIRTGKLKLPSWSVYAVSACLVLVIELRLADPCAVPLFAALIVALVEAPKSWLAKSLATPSAVLLGELSYSLYMINQRIILWINRLLPYDRAALRSVGFRAAVLIGLVGLILVLAFAIHFLVERPCREALRRWIERRFPVANARPGAPESTARASASAEPELQVQRAK